MADRKIRYEDVPKSCPENIRAAYGFICPDGLTEAELYEQAKIERLFKIVYDHWKGGQVT